MILLRRTPWTFFYFLRSVLVIVILDWSSCALFLLIVCWTLYDENQGEKAYDNLFLQIGFILAYGGQLGTLAIQGHVNTTS